MVVMNVVTHLVMKVVIKVTSNNEGEDEGSDEGGGEDCNLHPKSKLMRQFRNLCLHFEIKYLIQFFIKSGNQGHFHLQAKLISKPSLVVSFDKDLNELFKVKEKAYISKSSR